MTIEIDPALTGAAFDLANGGYAPMGDPGQKPERNAIGSDGASLRGAADRRSKDDAPIMVREYVDDEGRRAPSNEAITLARAARDHARIKAAQRHETEGERAAAVARQAERKHVTESADDSPADPLGPDRAESLAAEPADDSLGRGPSTGGLAPELEMALQHPQVLQAIEEKIAEAEAARQSYRDGLAAATQIAQAGFISQFPEFSGFHPDHVPAALEKMSREDPAKFARVQAAVAASGELLARQAQEQQRQAELSRQHFQKFAAAEDARLDTMLKDEPQSVRHAVAMEIMTVAKENGIGPDELNRLFHSEPVMRNSVFQRMMYDAAKYRLMIKAKDAVAARPLPPVLRPGVTAQGGRGADLRALNARLSSSGDLKDAVALYQARRSNRP
jgi:hypothetical protein